MRTFSKWIGMVGLLFGFSVGAAPQENGAASSLQQMKLAKRFGVGVSAGGPLAIFGVEADVNVTEELSITGGLGTGLNYSTFMLKGRYFLMGDWVSPYLGMAIARWWTDGTTATSIGPSVLTSQFLGAGYDYTKGFSVFLLSPAVGVQFMHPMGFAINAELQYLFRLFDFSNGTYAGLSAHWYF